jgi:hypothetical protein
MQPTTLQHPASADSYIRHGWALVPIPMGTKGPRTVGWNRKEAALTSAADLPPGHGMGLAHAYSGTMAVDIDEWSRAQFELALHGIDLNQLYEAPDAVIIDSGRAGRGKLLYAMPQGLVLPSHKLTDKLVDGTAYNYLDYRCGTINGLTVQDVLPPSIHPDTGQPYRWAGKGHWARLPTIPEALLTHWRQTLVTVEKKTIASGTSGSVSWDEIQSALGHLDSNCSRAEWIHIGMALHYAEHQSGATGRGQMLWDEWSRGSVKYPGERGVVTQWRAFSVDKENMVRLGTLFHQAKAAGWERPRPDISSMFSATDAPVVDMGDLFSGIRPEPPDPDLDLFPDLLRRQAQRLSKEMGSDPLVPLFAGMGAVCAAVDARSRLELLPRFKVPPVLWLMTIGDPAQKKSPAAMPMLNPLAQITQEMMPDYKRALLEWEGKEASWAAAKKAFLDFAGSPEAMLDAPMPHVPELPPRPASPRMTITDITSQKLVGMVADRPWGMLCWLDEMSSWCKKMTSFNSGEDRSTWVVAYEAGRYDVDRVGTGSISAENFAVSIYGNIQPTVYWATVKEMAADGMMQRFIPAILRNRDWGIGEPSEEAHDDEARWLNTLRLIRNIPAQTYRLSPEARESFRQFQHWHNAQKQDERLLRSGDTFLTAFGKLEGTLGRLALIWHVVESPFSVEVSKDLIDRVILFVQRYVVPAYRQAFGEMSGDRTTFDEWLADWLILNSDETVVTMSQIRAAYGGRWAGLNKWAQDQWILGGMALLEEARWVKRYDDGSMEHRHQAEWAVDPRLQNAFTTHREKLKSAARRRAAQALATRFWPSEKPSQGKIVKDITPEQMRELYKMGWPSKDEEDAA